MSQAETYTPELLRQRRLETPLPDIGACSVPVLDPEISDYASRLHANLGSMTEIIVKNLHLSSLDILAPLLILHDKATKGSS